MKKQDLIKNVVWLATEVNKYKKQRNLFGNVTRYKSLFKQAENIDNLQYDVITDKEGYKFIDALEIYGKLFEFEEE
jgi:hypothetical protein